MIGFERIIKGVSDTSLLFAELTASQQTRYKDIRRFWNFYDGYQWEDFPLENESVQLTTNYCRAFVDKFVSFELGKAFSFTVHKDVESSIVTDDGRTLFEYLEDVWEDNNQFSLCTELGQMKSVTGEAWLRVSYFSPEELDDPFDEYPKGRLKIDLIPTSCVFPSYNPHDREKLDKLTIMYQYEAEIENIFGKLKKEKRLYKEVWTSEKCLIYDGVGKEKKPKTVVNKYGVIPFVLIKNLPLAGRTECRGDLEDIIPLNVEYNLKTSNVSEILDYHASPITVVYGAQIGNLQKGANKVWGGLSKDSKVENLELKGDLVSSSNYIATLKNSMCEVSGVPEAVLGGSQSISNTSGVALQYMNLPLIEKTRIKRMNTETGIELLHKIVISVSLLEGIIKKPDDIPLRDFLHTEVSIPDTLPKDTLLELNEISQELELGLESRVNAMKRLGKENVELLIEQIDAERKAGYIVEEKGKSAKNYSGMLNGETPVETVRKEMTGSNGMS